MIARLKEDHQRLRSIADRLMEYLEQDDAPLAPEFPQLRWTLVRELTMHLAVERAAVPGWDRYMAASVGAEPFDLDSAFLQHVHDWSGASISRRWREYRLAKIELLARLLRRMDHEERAIFPAVAATGATARAD